MKKDVGMKETIVTLSRQGLGPALKVVARRLMSSTPPYTGGCNVRQGLV